MPALPVTLGCFLLAARMIANPGLASSPVRAVPVARCSLTRKPKPRV
jgi:hypothetical protein